MKQYRFPLLFILIYLLTLVAYESAPEWLVRDYIVNRATVDPGAMLINMIWPELQVSAQGSRIVSDHGSINVLRGCEGTETLLLFIAAILAAGSSWRAVLSGLLVGCMLIYVINQIRIIALFWVVVNHRHGFEIVHGYIAPLVVVGLASLYFLAWLRQSQTHKVRPASIEAA